MIFPTFDEVVKLNYRHVTNSRSLFVEPDNLRNAGSLQWVLEAIEYPLFGVIMYPTLTEKAAALAWIIIQSHVFHDGNKRTGMSILEIFLETNGYHFVATDAEIEAMALNIAGKDLERQTSFQDFVDWLNRRLVPHVRLY